MRWWQGSLLLCLIIAAARAHHEQPIPIRPEKGNHGGEGGGYEGGPRRFNAPQGAHAQPVDYEHVVADEPVEPAAAVAQDEAVNAIADEPQPQHHHVVADGPHEYPRDSGPGSPPPIQRDQQKPVRQRGEPPRRPVLMHNPPHVQEVPREQGPIKEADLSDEEYQRIHNKMALFDEERHEENKDWDDHSVMEDWMNLMEDFLPDMFVTFPLAPRGEEYFYQDFGPEPTRLRGAFFIAGVDDYHNKTNSIRLRVIDPQGQPIFEHRGGERVFHVLTKGAGTYTVFFANPSWMGQELRVTAVLGAGNETTLKMENINSVHDNVLVVSRMIRDIQAESKYLWSRQKSQMATVAKAHSGIVWISVLELLAVVILSAVQIFFLKSLVSHRRIF